MTNHFIWSIYYETFLSIIKCVSGFPIETLGKLSYIILIRGQNLIFNQKRIKVLVYTLPTYLNSRLPYQVKTTGSWDHSNKKYRVSLSSPDEHFVPIVPLEISDNILFCIYSKNGCVKNVPTYSIEYVKVSERQSNTCCWNKLFYKISNDLAIQTQSGIEILRKLSTWVETKESSDEKDDVE